MRKINIGIVGITGLVGQTILEVLESATFEIGTLIPFASQKSAGKIVHFKGQRLEIKALDKNAFDEPLDIVFFAVESDLAKIYAPLAAKKGIYVIDNSSAFRMDQNIPLIVPEVNAHTLRQTDYLIANPNCSTIQSTVALGVVDQLFEVVDVDYTTYQAVSGSGVNGLKDLERTKNGLTPAFYPKPIYNNILPEIDAFLDTGYTKEEMKMVLETQKILGKKLSVNATCVRVPVEVGHSVLIHATTKNEVDIIKLNDAYKKAINVVLYEGQSYPTPLDVAGSDSVHIGRIRKDINSNHKVLLWTVADNVRKGAATNAIMIAHHIVKEFLT